MDFPANFMKLSEKSKEYRRDEVCAVLEKLVTQSKLLENRLAVLASDIQALLTTIATLSDDVTRPRVANEDMSREEITANCLRLSLTLARNLCAGVQRNQAILCDSPLPDVVSKLINCSDGKAAALASFGTTALQLLGNLCVDFRAGQDKVWSLLYPNLFCDLLREESTSITEACQMIIYNCSIEKPDRMRLVCTNKKLVDVLWCKILSGGSEQEWGLLLLEHVITGGFIEDLYAMLVEVDHDQLHLVLLECVLEKLDDPNQCVVPDHLAECSSSCCLKTKDVVFLAKKFQCTIAVADLSKLDEDWKIVRVLLQLINTLSLQSSSLKILQQIPQLLESTIEFLRVLCIQDRTIHSAKNRTNLSDTVTSEDPNNQLFGLKRDLIRLIGNLCYLNHDNQNKVRHLDAITLLLNHFSIDDVNPYIQQWTIWAVRNICAGNEENQRVIKRLENRGLAKNETVASLLRLELEVGEDGKLRTKQRS